MKLIFIKKLTRIWLLLKHLHGACGSVLFGHFTDWKSAQCIVVKSNRSGYLHSMWYDAILRGDNERVLVCCPGDMEQL